jgi:hypothetical protein
MPTLSSLQESLQTVLPKPGTTVPPQAGTILDPSSLRYVSNPNTAMSFDNVNGIAAGLSATGIPINLGPALNLIDCAQNLEDRLIAKVQEKAIEYIMANDKAADILKLVAVIPTYINAANQIIDVIKSTKSEDLIMALLAAKALSGLERATKINEILTKFGSSVNNIVDLIRQLDVLDICSVPNYNANGTPAAAMMQTPTAPATASPITYPAASIDHNQIQIKNDYDGAMGEIKAQTSKDPLKADSGGYSSMITSINTIAMAYHDKLLKSTTSIDNPRFYSEFKTSVGIEQNTHGSQWDEATKSDYTTRCDQLGYAINKNADIIRAYGMRNNAGPISGSLLSKGVTVYSPPDGDFTTFLDLKPSARTPELTALWTSRGYNIQSQEAKLNSRGIKTGTLNMSDTVTGAMGDALISDFSCASTRVPIGSVLALKNADGSPYNPIGANPNGVYTVHDTGNAKLTYNKVDIFTRSPKQYTNMDGVQVYLVSTGTKYSSQYRIAQSKYGNGQV